MVPGPHGQRGTRSQPQRGRGQGGEGANRTPRRPARRVKPRAAKENNSARDNDNNTKTRGWKNRSPLRLQRMEESWNGTGSNVNATLRAHPDLIRQEAALLRQLQVGATWTPVWAVHVTPERFIYGPVRGVRGREGDHDPHDVGVQRRGSGNKHTTAPSRACGARDRQKRTESRRAVCAGGDHTPAVAAGTPLLARESHRDLLAGK
ncbi:hypothetical protein HPB48_019421 [Haemaphysalis longicornis]|uniref:Uncharacterized protein n=1 Tax=Haemaphysalis longicornis TaxID=44386 RepID=A0A9J6FYF1_HAELO|nr:hypothetical protein HPB48_019421 [Haemaphysalis longicornis]